jgi:hypothetical protein
MSSLIRRITAETETPLGFSLRRRKYSKPSSGKPSRLLGKMLDCVKFLYTAGLNCFNGSLGPVEYDLALVV